MDVRASLLLIQDVVTSPAFNRWRDGFVRQHMNSFDFVDENKLIYTTIHQQYEDEMEKQIIEGLPSTFDMAAFMQALPEYIEGPQGRNDEATGKAIQLLVEASDFVQFRNMMMFLKKEKEEQESKHTEDLITKDVTMLGKGKEISQIASSDVEGMMERCSMLASAAEKDEGWELMLHLDWMQIHKKPVEPHKRKNASEIYLRGVWTSNVNFVEACDMFFSMTDRRKEWDSNFNGVTMPFGGSLSDDEIVLSASLSFGYLVNLVMFGSGNGTVLTTKNIRKWNVPYMADGRRSVTYAILPWSVKENRLDTEHKLLTVKTGTIIEHPTLSDKVVMTTLEINSMGSLPNWAMSFMMRNTAPSMIRGLESKYISNVKQKGGVVDVTPAFVGGGGDGGGVGGEMFCIGQMVRRIGRKVEVG